VVRKLHQLDLVHPRGNFNLLLENPSSTADQETIFRILRSYLPTDGDADVMSLDHQVDFGDAFNSVLTFLDVSTKESCITVQHTVTCTKCLDERVATKKDAHMKHLNRHMRAHRFPINHILKMEPRSCEGLCPACRRMVTFNMEDVVIGLARFVLVWAPRTTTHLTATGRSVSTKHTFSTEVPMREVHPGVGGRQVATQLVATVHHHGPSAQRGHWTTWLRYGSKFYHYDNSSDNVDPDGSNTEATAADTLTFAIYAVEGGQIPPGTSPERLRPVDASARLDGGFDDGVEVNLLTTRMDPTALTGHIEGSERSTSVCSGSPVYSGVESGCTYGSHFIDRDAPIRASQIMSEPAPCKNPFLLSFSFRTKLPTATDWA